MVEKSLPFLQKRNDFFRTVKKFVRSKSLGLMQKLHFPPEFLNMESEGSVVSVISRYVSPDSVQPRRRGGLFRAARYPEPGAQGMAASLREESRKGLPAGRS